MVVELWEAAETKIMFLEKQPVKKLTNWCPLWEGREPMIWTGRVYQGKLTSLDPAVVLCMR